MSVADRLWSRVTVEDDGCWLWRGACMTRGYGMIGGAKTTHHLAYELLVGPVPAGLLLDHLCHTNDLTCAGGDSCRHRRCCNPDHLEPVTAAENTKRGRSAAGRAWIEAGVCFRGHPYTAETTFVIPSTGKRSCKTCRAERQRGYRRDKKEASLT